MWDWPEDPRPAVPPLRGAELAVLVGGMVVPEALLAAGWDAAFGGIGLVPVLAGMATGATGALVALVKRGPAGWLDRARLKRLAVAAGAAHVLLGGGAWLVRGGAGALGTATAAWGALAVGALVGLAALVVVLCAGDAVAMVLAPFPERPRDGRWRRR